MIYKKILSVLLFILLANMNLFAQDDSFTVLSFSGKVSFLNSGKKFNQIQTGDRIEKNGKIKLEKNSYTALMHKDGRTLEINTSGTYNHTNLIELLTKNNQTISQNFSKFVLAELTKSSGQKKDMKTFAAVVRVRPNFIETAVPSYTKIFENEFKFSWYKSAETKKYIFNLISPSNAVIYMKLIADTSININLSSMDIVKDACYRWFVYDADNYSVSSDTNCIIVMPSYQCKSISDSITQLEKALTAKDSPLNELFIASYLESNDLNSAALEHYNNAIMFAPDVEQYKEIIINFLLKNKLYKPASDLLKE